VPNQYFEDGGTLVAFEKKPGIDPVPVGGYRAIIGLKTAMNTTMPMKISPARAALFALNLRHAMLHWLTPLDFFVGARVFLVSDSA
jgi:hypothetical protein